MHSLQYTISSEREMCEFAQKLARLLKSGDMISLKGDLGAGKTFLAREIIRCLSSDPDLVIPSPTFTLVQAYQTDRFDVLHCDLYRLVDSEEIYELGLDDVEDKITLIEWYVRAEADLPDPSLELALSTLGETTGHEGNEARKVQITGSEKRLKDMADQLLIIDFLIELNWGDAQIEPVKGDASFRMLQRLRLEEKSAILMRMKMDDLTSEHQTYMREAGLAMSPAAFMAVSHQLRQSGLSAPEIYGASMDKGLTLVEDFGDDQIIDTHQKPIVERYKCVIDALADLHSHEISQELKIPDREGTHSLPFLDESILMREVRLCPEWFVEDCTGAPLNTKGMDDFCSIWQTLFKTLTTDYCLVMRDVHSPNVIWLHDRKDIQRAGFIDIQDALFGSKAYDVASLVQDARITIAPDLQKQLIEHYCKQRSQAHEASDKATFDSDKFKQDFCVLAAQRATKLLGTFTRLEKRDGKPEYRVHIPRIMTYLEQNLETPVLNNLRAWYLTYLPGIFDQK